MIAKLRSWWQFIKAHRITIQFIAILLVVAIILILIGYLFDWTGFNTYSITWLPIARNGASLPIASVEEQQPAKTFWDWLQLLGVLAIPVVVVWFTYTLQKRDRQLEQLQRERDQQLADRRAESERAAAEERAKTEREIATDNQREAALQAYFDRMAELLLKENLLKAQPGSEVRTIAGLRTSTVIRGLDPRRKGFVLQFVHGSGLIKRDDPIIEMRFANFSEANLRQIELTDVSLVEANFWKAKFYHAELSGDFRLTTFDDTELLETKLKGDFRGTTFNRADLCKAKLRRLTEIKYTEGSRYDKLRAC